MSFEGHYEAACVTSGLDEGASHNVDPEEVVEVGSEENSPKEGEETKKDEEEAIGSEDPIESEEDEDPEDPAVVAPLSLQDHHQGTQHEVSGGEYRN